MKAISRAQAEVGYFTDAINTANKIEFFLKKDESLKYIAIEQAKKGNVNSAFETINKITNSTLRYHALNSVFEELIEPHDLEYAIKYAKNNVTEEINDYFGFIVKAYIKLGDPNTASCIAMKIKNELKKDEVLKYIAKAKAETGDFTSAFALIKDIEIDYEYDETLAYISKSLAEANNFTSALRTREKLEKNIYMIVRLSQFHWNKQKLEITLLLQILQKQLKTN